ncbi:hypothetical protein ACWIG3_30220 [Streptomyces celluloflavus]
MFPKSKSGKLALCVLAGALTSAVVTGPALASGGDGEHGHFRGRVVARDGLLVRSGPSEHHRVVGHNRYGRIVRIECKVTGEKVRGNRRWYKLADGRYAWSSARFIVNLGEPPHWC